MTVKLAYEWPQKFEHFGAYIKPEALGKYEPYLGNEHRCRQRVCRRGSRSPAICTIARRSTIPTSRNTKSRSIRSTPIRPIRRWIGRTFFPLPATDKIATIEKEDVERATMFLPTHSTYFASYFTITGLHGVHVLGGVLVFIYMWLPVSKKLYQRNPEHLANRVEVAGLFWHFVDLVWIFVFPLFYLL